MEKRRERRWRYIDSVRFDSESVSGGEGHLADVAERGVFVRTDRTPLPGETVRVVLEVSQTRVELAACVRWVGRREDGALGFGAELTEPPQAYTDLVKSLEQLEGERARRQDRQRRGEARIKLSVPVAVEYGSLCDSGTLCDISLSGARLEDTGVKPEIGRQVTITFGLDDSGDTFELIARVIRATELGGYAVRFEAIDPRLKQSLLIMSSLIHNMPDSA